MDDITNRAPRGAGTGNMAYRGLRGWLEQVEKMGELRRSTAPTGTPRWAASRRCSPRRAAAQRPRFCSTKCPAIPKGYRTLYGQFSSIKRVALTLGLPLDYERKVDIVKRYYDACRR